MSRRGEPARRWTPPEVIKLRWYAERGFSMREAAKMLDRSWPAVMQQADRLDIHFHGPRGAPLLNRNRKLGEWRKEIARIAAGD